MTKITPNIKNTRNINGRSKLAKHSSLFINWEAVERVESFKFLGVKILADLTFSMHIPMGKMAQQRLHFLKKLRKLICLNPCCNISSTPPLRVFWPTAVQCCSASLLQRTGRTWSWCWEQQRGCLGWHYPRSVTITLADSSGKPAALSETHYTLDTRFFSVNPQDPKGKTNRLNNLFYAIRCYMHVPTT